MVLKYRLIPPHNGLYTGFDQEYFFGRVNAPGPPGKAGCRDRAHRTDGTDFGVTGCRGKVSASQVRVSLTRASRSRTVAGCAAHIFLG